MGAAPGVKGEPLSATYHAASCHGLPILRTLASER